MKYIQRVGFVFHSRHAKCLFIKKERKKKKLKKKLLQVRSGRMQLYLMPSSLPRAFLSKPSQYIIFHLPTNVMFEDDFKRTNWY